MDSLIVVDCIHAVCETYATAFDFTFIVPSVCSISPNNADIKLVFPAATRPTIQTSLPGSTSNDICFKSLVVPLQENDAFFKQIDPNVSSFSSYNTLAGLSSKSKILANLFIATTASTARIAIIGTILIGRRSKLIVANVVNTTETVSTFP